MHQQCNQTQGVSTGTGSGSQQQISKQYNIGCIGSTCANNQVQTDSGTSKQYNIGCINSTCVNPGGSGNQYNIGCINDICAYSGDGSSSSFSSFSSKYKPVSQTQSLTTSDATEIEAITTANSEQPKAISSTSAD